MPLRDKIKRPFSRLKKFAGGLAPGRSSSSINDHVQSSSLEPIAPDPASPPPVPNEPPAPSPEQSAPKTALVHGRAPGQLSSPINDHGQNNSPGPGPVAVNPVSSSPGPSDPPAPSTERSAKKTAWAALKTSLGLLQESADAFGPLKSAMGGLNRCIAIFEQVAQSREDYKTLAMELDSICQDLSGYLGGSTPPAMTSSIESLAKGIERETNFVQEKVQRTGLQRVVEAMDDSKEVMDCYSRIQRLLERLVRNTNMDAWRIVDEQATTNRLKSLPYSPAAKYLSAESATLRGEGCTENTRVDVLKTLRDWAYNNQNEKDKRGDQSKKDEENQEDEGGQEGETGEESKMNENIYWLSGMAGTGKTTIADSFCAELKGTGTLAASFFCSRQLPSCDDVNRIFPSISYQLAQFSRPFRHALSPILEQDSEAHNQPLLQQFEQLIAKPLRKVENTIRNDLVVVIDALDECVDQNGVDKKGVVLVLETLLSQAWNLPIRFFVTSRPEPMIRDRMLKRDGQQTRPVLHLHELERSIVREDIKTYLQVKLQRINLPVADLERLVERSGVLFIYAATLVRYIEANDFSRWAERLRLVLGASTSPSSIKDRPIDELYGTILHAAFDNPGLEDHEKEEMKHVLCTVVCAQEPLTVDVMAGLLGLDATDSVRPALQPLFSVLHVSETSGLVTTLHQSFPDYMYDQGRSNKFYCDKHQHNALLAERCFSIIGTPDPPFNICGLESSYLFDEDVPGLEERVKNTISPELFYACQYWGSHLGMAETSEHLVNAFREFLTLRLLLWMEVLNLKRCMHVGAGGLHQAQAWSQRTSCPIDIQQLVRDALGFVAAFSSSPASRSTPHIYISVLPFWPKHKPISKYYSQTMRLPKATGLGMKRRESAPLAICVAPGEVMCVGYSSNGARIVSGCNDGTIQIWDAHTGKMVGEPLQGHTNAVRSVAYSPDNARIVSGSGSQPDFYSGPHLRSSSRDDTIRIWDAHTGKMIGEPLQGHTNTVTSVAYSFDGTRIVSGSSDKTIRIWDAHTGKMIGEPLKGHTDTIWSVAYSPDSACIVSGSGLLPIHLPSASFPMTVRVKDNTIRIWDAHTGKMIGEPLKGHTSAVWSVAYSPDGTRIVSGSEDKTIRIWDAHTGKMIGKPLKGHTSGVTSVAWSSDSTSIVSSSGSGYQTSVRIDSPRDRAIGIWDAHTGKMIGEMISEMIGEPLRGHLYSIRSVAYSPDSTRIVSGSGDKTIRIWDVHTRKMVGEPLEGHTDGVTSVAYSSDGTRIASSSNKTIRMWDAHTGKMIGEPLEGHTGAVWSVAYSPDSTRIVSGSGDKTIRIWDAYTGKMIGEPLEGHTGAVMSVAYSPDGTRIASSSNKTIRMWDAHSGKMIGEPLQGHTKMVTSVAYSSDGTRIISGSFDKTIRMWDVQTGEMIGEPLEGHTDMVWSVAYSPDGIHIASGSYDKTIRMWDVRSGKMIGEPLQGHTGVVTSVAYSSDGARIVSGSADKTIRMWDAQTGKMIDEPLEGHTDGVTSVAFSSDCARIVSGSSDKTIRIWDAHTGKVFPSGSYSSDGGCIVPGSGDKTARVAFTHTTNDLCKTWVLDKDGYMRTSDSKFLMWVPLEVRGTLMRPQNIAVISVQGSVKVDFTDAPIGDSWAQCYQAT